MSAPFRRSKTKCANLAESEITKETQLHPFFSPGAFDHKQAQNKPANCKTETAVPAGPRNGGKTFAKASNFHGSEYVGYGLGAIPNMPSRAALARKWPKLRINRLTWRWRDDASGAYGSDVASLLAFLGEGAR